MKHIIKEVLAELTREKLNEESKSFNIPSSFFESGKDEVTSELDQNIKSGPGPALVRFLKSNPGKIVDIVINSSESKVPNPAPFNKPKSLAMSRGNKLKAYFEKNLQQFKDRVRFKVVPVVSGPEWDGKNKDDKKYTDAQYVKVSYELTNDKVKSAFKFTDSPFCKSKTINFKGGQAKEPNYIGYDKTFEVGEGDGTFSFVFVPYMYPDRLVMKSGDNIVDTGFVSSKGISDGRFEHILYLSTFYHNNPNSPAFQNIDTIIDISNVPSNEVSRLIIKTMQKQGVSLEGASSPTNSKFVLENFGEGKPITKLVYFKQVGASFNLTKDPNDSFVKMRVFSPVADTIFDVNYSCR